MTILFWVVIALIAFAVYSVAVAPRGYEDDYGFHLGDPADPDDEQ
jgi:hypothetical protein